MTLSKNCKLEMNLQRQKRGVAYKILVLKVEVHYKKIVKSKVKTSLLSENLAHCRHIRGTMPLKKGFFVEKGASIMPIFCRESL